MHCAFSWAMCPAQANQSRNGQQVACENVAGGDIACAVPVAGAVRLLIGDVMGHGPRAAATATAVSRRFRSLAAAPVPLTEIANRLHDFIARRPGHPSTWGEEFVTAQFIEVPLAPEAPAEIVCCGHPPPLLLRGACPGADAASGADDIAVAPLDELPRCPPHGLPLGLIGLDDRPAEASRLPAAPGDALLFYTDGVSEACDESGRLYPLAERAAALASGRQDQLSRPDPGQPGQPGRPHPSGHADQPPGAVRPLPERILADLHHHAAGNDRAERAALPDDATLIYLEFTHAPIVTPVPVVTGPQIVRFY